MIALVFGDNSVQFAKDIESNSDVKGLQGYRSIGELLALSEKRGLVFERIVLRANLYNVENELYMLERFLRNTNATTSVVFLYRVFEKTDVDLAKKFSEIFTSPIYTDVGIDAKVTTDIRFQVDLISKSIDNLRKRFSNFNHYAPQVQAQVVEETKEEVKIKPVTLPNGASKEFKFGGFWSRKKLTKAQKSEVLVLYKEAEAVVEEV